MGISRGKLWKDSAGSRGKYHCSEFVRATILISTFQRTLQIRVGLHNDTLHYTNRFRAKIRGPTQAGEPAHGRSCLEAGMTPSLRPTESKRPTSSAGRPTSCAHRYSRTPRIERRISTRTSFRVLCTYCKATPALPLQELG